MSLSIGIVGLPNVGKSTLFNALTKAGALAANYPFATIEPNVGVVGVPDPRLGPLAELYNSARVVPASVRFTDIAGLVKAPPRGRDGQPVPRPHPGDRRDLPGVRVFRDPDVTRVDGSIGPEGDIETIVTELILADLQTLEKAAPRLAKETKFAKDPDKLATAAAAEAAVSVLDSGKTLFAARPRPRSRCRRCASSPADGQAVHLRLQHGRDELGDDDSRSGCRSWWRRPRRSSSTPSPSPS